MNGVEKIPKIFVLRVTWMKSNGLLYLMITGILLGIFCGWFFGETMLSVGWLGDMFLDSLKMLVVPLIISSMIVGISGLGDIRKV